MSNRMLQRDYYLKDYTRSYWPSSSMLEFNRIFSLPIAYKACLLRNSQRSSFKAHQQRDQNIIIGSLTTAITVSLFYRMIPGLNTTSRSTRLATTLGLFLAVYLIGVKLSTMKAKKLEEMFRDKEKGWRQWRITGDFRRINPDLKMEELPEEVEEIRKEGVFKTG